MTGLLTTGAQFLGSTSRSVNKRVKDWELGYNSFLRLGDGARVGLLADLITLWLDQKSLNCDIVGGFFRPAWCHEPYLGGPRRGSFFTEVRVSYPELAGYQLSEVVEEWGINMMMPDEAAALDAMPFPLTVYRGGVGEMSHVAAGISWTLSLEIAKFYSDAWPKRFGDNREPVILSTIIESDDAAAFFDDRSEKEVLIPYISEHSPQLVQASLNP